MPKRELVAIKRRCRVHGSVFAGVAEQLDGVLTGVGEPLNGPCPLCRLDAIFDKAAARAEKAKAVTKPLLIQPRMSKGS